jgi:hypothetical protein
VLGDMVVVNWISMVEDHGCGLACHGDGIKGLWHRGDMPIDDINATFKGGLQDFGFVVLELDSKPPKPIQG